MYVPLQHICQLATYVMCMCTYMLQLFIILPIIPFVLIRNELQYGELNSTYAFWLNVYLSIILPSTCIPSRLPTSAQLSAFLWCICCVAFILSQSMVSGSLYKKSSLGFHFKKNHLVVGFQSFDLRQHETCM